MLRVAEAQAVALPSCVVCLGEYGPGPARPWDLGCGHTCCERCVATWSGPTNCPIDRTPWLNPHVSYDLLSTVEGLLAARGAAADDVGGASASPAVDGHTGAPSASCTRPGLLCLGMTTAPSMHAEPLAWPHAWHATAGASAVRRLPADPFKPLVERLTHLSALYRAFVEREVSLRELLQHVALNLPSELRLWARVGVPGVLVLLALRLWR